MLKYAKALARKNGTDFAKFIGGGIYNKYIPACINYIAQRFEFLTAYTPYQPEISQGTLQIIYEYQTMISRLTGMDISNATMYDGASACAEALLMSARISKKNKVLGGIIAVSFVLSGLFTWLPFTAKISSGMRTIVLTVLIAGAAAVLFPVKDEEQEGGNDAA